ncbi:MULTISPECIES: Lrp/AsnC family transcriptional regulator [Natrialbaceae]|uniref:Lrp/AsnC family transcriptional regulator n=1 Tax=Natrialbaceae TaxID=1644061 RepID=UPI00207D542D|nr:winged helix-turn-helix transcriptional regulator [Natronococcus sp. CG52]
MANHPSGSAYQLDELDRRILYELMADARDASAPVIADRIDVSPGTVRNRIERLEERGVITGYHAHVDLERTDGRLATLFMCSVPFADRKTAARAAYQIPGAVNVRILMGGRRNFHVLAVGENARDLRRIGTTLSEIGIEIEDEMLVENDEVRAYEPFGPDGTRSAIPATFIDLSGDSEVVELTVQSDAPIAGVALSDAAENGLLDEDPLVVSITRDDELLTPHGDTTIRPADVVTVFSCGGVEDETIRAFVGAERGGVRR